MYFRLKKEDFKAGNRRCEKQRNKKSEKDNNLRIKKTIQSIKIFPTYKSIPLKGIVNWVENKECGKEKKIERSRQSAECGGNQDVRYQDRSEMTLDYKKLFRWQETSSQGSFHVAGKPPRAVRAYGWFGIRHQWVVSPTGRCGEIWFDLFAP